MIALGLALAFLAAARAFRRRDAENSNDRLALGVMAAATLAALALGMTFTLDRGMLTVALALSALGAAFVDRKTASNLHRYGHGLVNWRVYLNVTRGVTMLRTTASVADVFSLTPPHCQAYRWKRYMTTFYRPLYAEILQSILNSPVIHIDETGVELRGQAPSWQQRRNVGHRPTRHPQPFSEATSIEIHGKIAEGMRAAGIREEVIYAYDRTDSW